MSKQEEIIDGLAQYHYSYPDGKPTIRRKWEGLLEDEKKPYIDIAKLEVGYLDSKGVVIKVERELPHPAIDNQYLGKIWVVNEKDMAGYVAVESLIK